METKRDRQEMDDGEQLQREVLALLLVEHPVRLTPGEVQRVLGRPLDIAPAIAALVADGLLTFEGDDVVPTPAALRFNQLEPIEPPEPA